MTRRVLWRLQDIKQGILDIRALLGGKDLAAFAADRVARAACERFFEIISEASRHVPENWKTETAPEIPWRRVADLGNHIRHAYDRIDPEVLWNLYLNELDQLESAVDRMLSRYGSARE